LRAVAVYAVILYPKKGAKERDRMIEIISKLLEVSSSIKTVRRSEVKRVVLCVDDDRLQLEMRVAILEAAGYSVLSTTCPVEALRLCATGDIDAVVSDYNMPDIKGSVLATAVHLLDPVPFILCSGNTDVPQKAREIADAFISKADPPVVLLTTLRKVLASYADGS
jgi:CheY-like chemotaxis protein